MQTLYGKYNCAQVMVDTLDGETRAQIQAFLDNPSFHTSPIAIMPDCHAGTGSCIGFTMPMNDRIIPAVVGVDIGCGMLAAKFPLQTLDLPAFDAIVQKTVPAGFASHKTRQVATREFSATVKRLGLDEGRVLCQLGTLGGGNHFIEAGFGQDANLWLTIHSGSRHFGLQIAKYYSHIAKQECDTQHRECRGIPYLEVHSASGQGYLEAQQVGVRYAQMNRTAILHNLAQILKCEPVETIESVHNFIDAQGMIRKGATPAHAGQRLVIPFNMRDGLALCTGKGNALYNHSAPHGAGRLLSRSQAKAKLSVAHFQQDMRQAGVFTTTANQSTLDESPEAYKDMQLILSCITDAVCIDEIVKPVYNFKSSGE